MGKAQACHTSIERGEDLQPGVSGHILMVRATKENREKCLAFYKVRVENKVFKIRAHAGTYVRRFCPRCQPSQHPGGNPHHGEHTF